MFIKNRTSVFPVPRMRFNSLANPFCLSCSVVQLLEVNEGWFDASQIRLLYDGARFPAEKERRQMITRSRRETVVFKHPFRIKGIDRLLAAGAYEVVTDEEMIEGLSFPSFRRIATMIMIAAAPPHNSSIEMISIGSVDLVDAQRIDAGVSL